MNRIAMLSIFVGLLLTTVGCGSSSEKPEEAYAPVIAPANFAAVKHTALNALRKAPGKDSLQSKRFLAASDEDDLAKALSAR